MHRLVTYHPTKTFADGTPAKPWSMFLPTPRRAYDPDTNRWTWQAAQAITIPAGRGARRRARKMALKCGTTVAVVSKRGREVYRHTTTLLAQLTPNNWASRLKSLGATPSEPLWRALDAHMKLLT